MNARLPHPKVRQSLMQVKKVHARKPRSVGHTDVNRASLGTVGRHPIVESTIISQIRHHCLVVFTVRVVFILGVKVSPNFERPVFRNQPGSACNAKALNCERFVVCVFFNSTFFPQPSSDLLHQN